MSIILIIGAICTLAILGLVLLFVSPFVSIIAIFAILFAFFGGRKMLKDLFAILDNEIEKSNKEQ